MKADKSFRRDRRALLAGGALMVPGLALVGCTPENEPRSANRESKMGSGAADGADPAGVVRLSVKADTDEDVTEAFEEAIGRLHPSQATTIQLDRGTYRVRNIVIPTDRTVIIRGMGLGYVGGSFGTQIRRYDDGDEPLLLAEGASGELTSAELNTPPFRTRLELYDLELHGNESSGAGLRVFRGQQCNFERIRVTRCGGSALHLTQMFNSSLSRVFTSYSGRGDDTPAMLVDGTDEDSTAGTNTLHLTDCEWETNEGTDLVVDGYTGAPSVGVLVTSAKFERSAGGFPLIRVTRYGKVQLDNSYLYLGSDTDHHLLQSAGSFMASNVHLAHGGSPKYQVRHDDGLLMMVAVQSEARVTDAVVRVAEDVPVGRCVLRGVTSIDDNRLVRDNRDLSVKLGTQVVNVPLDHSNATSTPVDGGLAWGWALPAGSNREICAGQTVMPAGLPDDARCQLVLRWSVKSGGKGEVVLAATVGSLHPGSALTSQQKQVQTTVEAPSTGVLVESVLSPGFTVREGQLARVQARRASDEADDTFAGDVILLTAHLLVSSLP